MDRLQNCIQALHVLAEQANDSNAQVLAEREINEFLRAGEERLSASLELVSKAIDAEANKDILGEDWSLMRAYVQWCRERLASKG
jgi:hypothetical protein